jgi:hypothetical protein
VVAADYLLHLSSRLAGLYGATGLANVRAKAHLNVASAFHPLRTFACLIASKD